MSAQATKQSERCCYVSRFSLYDGDSTYTGQPKQSEQHREPDQRPARFANCCTGTPQRWRRTCCERATHWVARFRAWLARAAEMSFA